MKKGTQNKSTQLGNRIVLVSTATLLLAYMLLTIVRAYLAGGSDAPDVKTLLLGIVVLGGGAVFTVVYLVLLLKQYYRKPEEPQQPQEDVAE